MPIAGDRIIHPVVGTARGTLDGRHFANVKPLDLSIECSSRAVCSLARDPDPLIPPPQRRGHRHRPRKPPYHSSCHHRPSSCLARGRIERMSVDGRRTTRGDLQRDPRGVWSHGARQGPARSWRTNRHGVALTVVTRLDELTAALAPGVTLALCTGAEHDGRLDHGHGLSQPDFPRGFHSSRSHAKPDQMTHPVCRPVVPLVLCTSYSPSPVTRSPGRKMMKCRCIDSGTSQTPPVQQAWWTATTAQCE